MRYFQIHITGASLLLLTASLLLVPQNTAAESDKSGFVWGHPVTISLSGQPDFLSGGWRKEDGRVPRLSAMRLFDLDGTGSKMWEWVGPTEGLLVWNSENKPDYQPTYKDLFGFHTWGKKWSDGLQALISLDANKDGLLEGPELLNLWVWGDKNSDAVVQDGEMLALGAAGIVSLGLKFADDEQGGVWVKDGAHLKGDLPALPILEWWSLGGMDKDTYLRYIDSVLREACVYQWDPQDKSIGGTGGLVRYFILDNGLLGALTIPFDQAEGDNVTGLTISYDLQEDGTFLSRVDMGDHWLENYLSIAEDGTIVGMTGEVKKGRDQKLKPMAWTAKKVSGSSLDHLLDAVMTKKRLENR